MWFSVFRVQSWSNCEECVKILWISNRLLYCVQIWLICSIAFQVIFITGSAERPNNVNLGRIFTHLHSLEEVTIKYSNLPAITNRAFAIDPWLPSGWTPDGYSYSTKPNLTKIDLSHNRIRIIEAGDFIGLGNLRHLDLSSNILKEVPSAPFQLLTNLTYLSLARNNMSTLVPRLFMGLGRLEVLDLSENPLSGANITGDNFQDIPKLKVLRMEKCQLSSISLDTWEKLSNLEELHLQDNQLTILFSYHFRHLRQLKTLNLDGNFIHTIRDKAFSGLYLRHLGLSRNNLKTLPSCAFCDVLSIQSLDLSGNHFTQFDSELLAPVSKTLIVLSAAQNTHLTDASISIARLLFPLIAVQIIKLPWCRINDSLPEETFVRLSRLETLDLSGNYISSVNARWIKPLLHLESLDLSGNRLHSIDEEAVLALDGLTTLQSIRLGNNPWICRKCFPGSPKGILPLLSWITSPSNRAYPRGCFVNSSSPPSSDGCVTCPNLSNRPLHTFIPGDLDSSLCDSDEEDGKSLRFSTSESTKVGIYLAMTMGMSCVAAICFIAAIYKYKRGAVYYTHEGEAIICPKSSFHHNHRNGHYNHSGYHFSGRPSLTHYSSQSTLNNGRPYYENVGTISTSFYNNGYNNPSRNHNYYNFYNHIDVPHHSHHPHHHLYSLTLPHAHRRHSDNCCPTHSTRFGKSICSKKIMMKKSKTCRNLFGLRNCGGHSSSSPLSSTSTPSMANTSVLSSIYGNHHGNIGNHEQLPGGKSPPFLSTYDFTTIVPCVTSRRLSDESSATIDESSAAGNGFVRRFTNGTINSLKSPFRCSRKRKSSSCNSTSPFSEVDLNSSSPSSSSESSPMKAAEGQRGGESSRHKGTDFKTRFWEF